ncbi:40S ribosomal protein S8 (nucleomorph) [Chroomonas mesostigmatica CCMP1168]|uniref:40S ribosomal protein S8 n=1 Tax=Chroomonas mesostigmatica CCMP1168 TaxID=1195612 RepID=J7G3A8_9CRYP|nr:40S ribosomal protein S8 [Chroomonas mesostigmatica CCMP1168]|mmetsp:Transcript_25140/g.61793  ORF Transcript_25140/g.61793 Transcript_25140/m.61793 type:complete len:376 (+) Transcript_25140:540-1667(+)
MGISRDILHKKKSTGGKKRIWRKKRKHELGRPSANTKIGNKQISLIRVRGGNIKKRALKLDQGNFSLISSSVTRKARIISVAYNATNNELVRTNTLVKGSIIFIDSTPFKTWHEKNTQTSAKRLDISKFEAWPIYPCDWNSLTKPEKNARREKRAAVYKDLEQRALETKKEEKAIAKKFQNISDEEFFVHITGENPSSPKRKIETKKIKKIRRGTEYRIRKAEKKREHWKRYAKKVDFRNFYTDANTCEEKQQISIKLRIDRKRFFDNIVNIEKVRENYNSYLLKHSNKKKKYNEEKKLPTLSLLTRLSSYFDPNIRLELTSPGYSRYNYHYLHSGKLLARICSRPGQTGRSDGYVLEQSELRFYLKKMNKKIKF